MEIIDIKRDLNNAQELGEALADLINAETTYVVGPDGSPIGGFKVVEETLMDGSKAQSVFLLAAPSPRAA